MIIPISSRGKTLIGVGDLKNDNLHAITLKIYHTSEKLGKRPVVEIYYTEK